MTEIIYRLGEYKIIENNIGGLSWEAHSGIGVLRSGICFIKGNILFIGPVEKRQEGFLKLEFLENIKTNPFWLKTKYFCSDPDIFHCLNGKKVNREERLLWQFQRGKERNNKNNLCNFKDCIPAKESEETSFRLQKYKITKYKNGNIVWSSNVGANIIKSGQCIILEDIIFLCPPTDSLSTNKRQFTADLQKLQEWNLTSYYSPRNSLQECERTNEIWSKKKSFIKRRSLPGKDSETRGHFKGNEQKPAENLGNLRQTAEPDSTSTPPVRHSNKRYILPVALFIMIISLLSALSITHLLEHRSDGHKKGGEYYHRGYHRR